MSNAEPTWNLTTQQWETLTARVRASRDPLEDGSLALVERNARSGGDEIVFYATALNKPEGWPYAFPEMIPQSQRAVASIGRAWHEPETGFAHFEVALYAAAQSLAADYEGGAGDFDDVSYEIALEQAVHGRPEDEAWLKTEFGRLARLALE